MKRQKVKVTKVWELDTDLFRILASSGPVQGEAGNSAALSPTGHPASSRNPVWTERAGGKRGEWRPSAATAQRTAAKKGTDVGRRACRLRHLLPGARSDLFPTQDGGTVKGLEALCVQNVRFGSVERARDS